MAVIKTRDSNFELLRIISMFMIVVLHMGTFGFQKAIDLNTGLSEYNQFIYHFLRSLSIISVNIYVLISAYFLSKSKVKGNKVIRLFLETSFFCTTMFILNVLFNKTVFNAHTLKESLLAVIFREYWFVTVFLVLIVLSPYINKLIDVLSRKEYTTLLCIFFVLTSIWGFYESITELGVNRGYSLIFFIFLYLLGGYIRRYDFIFKSIHKNLYFVLYLFIASLNSFIVTGTAHNDSIGRWYWYNSPLVVIMSYMLFQYFKSINLQSVKINFISKYVFGIYLVHEQPMIRDIIWKKSGIVKGVLDINQKLIMPTMLLVCAALFVLLWIVSFALGILFNFVYNKIEKWLFEPADFSADSTTNQLR
ncbi:surface polysaccharide O-acyltransferase-like enzyme [Paenibacillus favisporus]|uniref:Surface polysaccharide O-acyltransferase-like enzyme n=1 Tax=Paenibacillus favisporus TaxID=221028 RepID=A0ABV2F8T0_9BACL